ISVLAASSCPATSIGGRRPGTFASNSTLRPKRRRRWRQPDRQAGTGLGTGGVAAGRESRVPPNNNYWVRGAALRLSRRRLLAAGAGLTVAGAGLGLAGCGSGTSGGEAKKSGSALLYVPVDSTARASKGGVF